MWGQAIAAHQARMDQVDNLPRPPQTVMDLIDEREKAREAGNWTESDQLRDEIKSLGWQVNDTPDGPELAPKE